MYGFFLFFGSELGLIQKKEVIYILQCIIPRIEELLAINVDKAGPFTDMVIFNNYIYSRRMDFLYLNVIMFVPRICFLLKVVLGFNFFLCFIYFTSVDTVRTSIRHQIRLQNEDLFFTFHGTKRHCHFIYQRSV